MKTYTTLERVYNEMLGVLPPADMKTGAQGVQGFLVGEPTDHNAEGMPRYSAFFACDDEYITAGPLTVAQFRAACDMSEQELRDDEETPEDVEKELRLIEQYSEDAVNAYHALGFEKDHGLDGFEEAYAGQFDDWEQAARELMYDYAEEGGYYFRNC